MTKEIGSLRTRLSFEKTGESDITSLTRDLKGVRSEMNNFRASSREYRTSMKGMHQESDILTRRLKVQKEEVSELKRRYDSAREATGENSAKTKDLAAQYNNAQAEMKRTQGQLDRLNQVIKTQESRWTKLGNGMEKYGAKLTKFGDSATRFGRTYSMRVTAPIVGAGIAALKVGMDFEEGMSKVQAISGATGEEMSTLSGLAKEMGSTTKFSATEAAGGMEFLAMSGMDTNEIIATMPGLLDLAASSGMELARAADIATNILSGFGYEADQAGRLSDVLAKGASTANTNVEQLGAAMETVAPIASLVGLEIEGLTAGVGKMSDAGIQGQKAGRMLRQGILRLSDPTGKAADLIKELGINVFDADGNMKDLDKVVGELSGGLEGMDSKTQAAALSTIFGSESTAGWSALLKVGEKDLRAYTKELENSEGAAKEMADTMQDNAKGAITELKSALEGAGIAISEHLIPAVTDGVKWITDLVRKFGDLDDEQQKQILKWAGIVAAIGPASLAIGGVAKVTGGFLTVGGKLFKMMGKASGAGLIGRFALMGGPAGPVILAAGALGLLGVAAYNLFKDKEKLHEITTETADKFTEQADTLESLVEKYDELEIASKLTNDEFGRMVDIQKELESTQNPARVAELKDEYEHLRKKSGMTNAEIEEMIGLNKDIIDQSPDVEKSFTDKGNAIVESTDAVHEHIQSLRDLALEELIEQRYMALENEQTLLEENIGYNKEIAELNEDITRIMEQGSLSSEEIKDRMSEINGDLRSGKFTLEEREALQKELIELAEIESKGHLGLLEIMMDERDELQGKIDLNDEEIAKLEAINIAITDNLLGQVDINWEKGEGLNKLDETIQKLKDERAEIMKNMTEEERVNGVHDKYLEGLDQSISKHEEVKNQIKEETGYQSEHNAKVDEQNIKLKNAGLQYIDNEGNVRKVTVAQEGTNKKIGEGISKAYDLTQELRKDATKKVDVKDYGTAKGITDEASKAVTKKVSLNATWLNLSSAMSKITSGVRGAMPAYADGTSYHPGGLALVGEEGYELARHGSAWSMLGHGITNLPRGTEVFTHDESKSILRAMNNLPAYASGISSTGEASRVVGGLNNQQQQSRQPIVLEVHVTSELDGRVVGESVAEVVTEVQDRNKRVVESFA